MADESPWVRSHREWRARLLDYVNGKSKERLNAATVGRDDACELGQWILAERATQARGGTFAALMAKHTEFHRLAAQIVHAKNSGRREDAMRMLAPGSAFFRASNDVIAAIEAFERREAA